MTTALIGVPAGELSEKMAAMHERLNERRYEPSKFTCDRYGNVFAVFVGSAAMEKLKYSKTASAHKK